jgi:hypothetical protein
MSARNRSGNTTEAWWALLTAILKSMRDRPFAWLAGVWLCGWALIAWHAIHPASWEGVWSTVNSVVTRAQNGDVQPTNPQGSITWLQEVAKWGQSVLFISTGLLALYTCYALWVWWRYMHVWMPQVHEERLREGRTLEVLIPRESKSDARAAADMLDHLWNLLSETAQAGRGFGPRRMGAEQQALSFEMWSTPHTGGKVGFYIWCPAAVGEQDTDENSVMASLESARLVEEVRHLIKVYHPDCRVRWVRDPAKKALHDVTQPAEVPDMAVPAQVAWYDLGLLADSRYPIGSGASSDRSASGTRPATRPANRSGSPGAGSDPLAAVMSMLWTDKDVPVMGIQVIIAALPAGVARNQQTVNRELERLRALEAQAGKKSLGPQHEARVLALEEKADRQGFDAVVRLVTMERTDEAGQGTLAEARLAALFRKYRQYDRSIAGARQGFQVVGRGQTVFGAAIPVASVTPRIPEAMLMQAGPVFGRWSREGLSLPRLLPLLSFIRKGKPCILNTTELSALYHFPHQGLEGVVNLLWGPYRQIPPPAEARMTSEQVAEGRKVMLGALDEDLPPTDMESKARWEKQDLARTEKLLAMATEGVQRPEGEEQEDEKTGVNTGAAEGANVLPPGLRGVGTDFDEMRRGTYVLGPMGSGKSVLLCNVVAQYMAAGRGVGILDGKGDTYWDVLQLVPPHLEGEVLTFDPENRSKGGAGKGGSGGRSIGINPLDGRVAAQFGAEKVESLTMSLMRKMMGANWEQAVLMQRFLRGGIIAVLQAEQSPTMLNLWRWFQDDGRGGNEYRDALVGKISNLVVRDFWQRQVPAMSSQNRSSMQNVLTRVDRYVKNDVRYLLLQPYSTVNFQQIMDQGTIFVGKVSPRLGEDQSFLGALVLNGFLTGAFARDSIPQQQRRDYLLVMDEFQNFVDTAREDVERMLSMARGYRLGLMLAHQYTDQLPKEVLSAILKNVQTWVAFGLQADDARRFAGYMDGLEAEDFRNLPPYYTYQSTTMKDVQTGVYSAAPLPVPIPAANPGERRVGNLESEMKDWAARETLERNREVLRAANAPEQVLMMVRGEPEESEEARRARIMGLAMHIYMPAEEGDPEAVQILSTLSESDRDLYRRARRKLDEEEREFLLAHPQLIPDKVERIERLSALRWGTPCAEVEALILATLRDGGFGPNGGIGAPGGPKPAPKIQPYNLLPDLDGADQQPGEDIQDEQSQ